MTCSAKRLIVVLSGRKQSGKTTTCNYFAARYLNSLYPEASGFGVNHLGELTLRGQTPPISLFEFNDIKVYSFADPLKEFCVNVMGAKHEQCYGTDAEKDSLIPHILWDNVHHGTNPRQKTGPMSGRELMQWFGTDICRKVYYDIWAQSTYTKIKNEKKKIALIADGRFPNEILLGKKNQQDNVIIKTLRLLRAVKEDNHPSETALDDFPLDQYSAVLDNRQMSLTEQCEALNEYVSQWFEEAGITNE